MSSQEEINRKVRQVSDVQARYTDELMQKPHVIGTAVGYTSKGGARTGNIGLIVMVDQKVPPDELAPSELIPRELDGVPVDVQETGVFSAQ